jgi:translation initiation factor 2 beta subunit (eIF-2beta)/eIF-5
MKSTTQKVNVPRDIPDPSYRYKMHIIKVKVEGKGKMVKTVLENIDEVAKDLERPTEYITKFFAYELSVQYQMKNKKHTLGSARNAEDLMRLLDVFIEKLLLCGTCHYPETILCISKNQLALRCRACGHKTYVNYQHRITDYIFKKIQAEKKEKKKVEKQPTENPVDTLKNLWKQELDDEDILGKVKMRMMLDKEQLICLLFESLFDDELLDNFDEKARIFKLFKEDEKFSERTLFSIEKLCQNESTLLPTVWDIIRLFMKKELVSISSLKKWQANPNSDIDPSVSNQIRSLTQTHIASLE